MCNFTLNWYQALKERIVHEFLTPEKVQSQQPRFRPHHKTYGLLEAGDLNPPYSPLGMKTAQPLAEKFVDC
jgi:hypothetical protein